MASPYFTDNTTFFILFFSIDRKKTMPRLNLVFPDTYFAMLQANAAKQGVSIARYARDLMDMGLQVEEATAQQRAPNAEKDNAALNEDEVKAWWKNSLLCALESRYLIRYLVDNLTHQPDEKREAVLAAVKEKAQNLVSTLIPD
jgi:hypothetical protein